MILGFPDNATLLSAYLASMQLFLAPFVTFLSFGMAEIFFPAMDINLLVHRRTKLL
jgi:hypothetical protein